MLIEQASHSSPSPMPPSPGASSPRRRHGLQGVLGVHQSRVDSQTAREESEAARCTFAPYQP